VVADWSEVTMPCGPGSGRRPTKYSCPYCNRLLGARGYEKHIRDHASTDRPLHQAPICNSPNIDTCPNCHGMLFPILTLQRMAFFQCRKCKRQFFEFTEDEDIVLVGGGLHQMQGKGDPACHSLKNSSGPNSMPPFLDPKYGGSGWTSEI
jgi:hypothetical protein